MATEYQIEPNTETPIPGTGFTVQHGGDEETYVHVREDGTIELAGPFDWTLRRAPAEPTGSFYLIWSNHSGLWWRANGAGYTPDVLAAGRYTRAEVDRYCGTLIWEKDVRVPKDVVVMEPSTDLLLAVAGRETYLESLRDRIREANRSAIEARKATQGA